MAVLFAMALVAVFFYSPSTVAATTATACPVRLVNIGLREDGEEGLQLEKDGLDYIAQLQSPLYVVTMVGVYRGGKSMLLNRIMGLRAPYTNGFAVGHGQQTFTRGIDMCAEEVAGLGTVVWMDTEGLWSAQDARSAHGVKIFSLALLFSSALLLNSVKVLNDQFFGFFGEQQQIARVLKQGLTSEGVPPDTLLPVNLSLLWVLQQPVRFDSTNSDSQTQLETFLDARGDEMRARVRRDFRHSQVQVPTAVHNVLDWARLDRLPDDELLPDYVVASERVREAVLRELRDARPMHATSMAKQLAMFTEVVQTERFNGALAKEAFEENELAALCSDFATGVTNLAGELPSATLRDAFEATREAIDGRLESVIESFHFSAGWAKRLNRCLQQQVADLEKRNGELVLALWQTAAGHVAEEKTSCFFLGTLVSLLQEYVRTYGPAFGRALQSRAVEYGTALQRARLVECVRLRDFLWPFAPWLGWPVCNVYLRSGSLVSGIMSIMLHGVVLAGIYTVLQFANQLPPYLNLDYPILRNHPMLLGIVIRAPPMVPWSSLGSLVGILGIVHSVWKLLKCVAHLGRPAGHGHTVNQLINLELKLNMLVQRSEASFRQQLTASALDAAAGIERSDACVAALALVKGLCLVRDLALDERVRAELADSGLHTHVRLVLASFELPPPADGHQRCCGCSGHNLASYAARGDWTRLVGEMAGVLQKLTGLRDGRDATQEKPAVPTSPSQENAGDDTSEVLGHGDDDAESVATSEASAPPSEGPSGDSEAKRHDRLSYLGVSVVAVAFLLALWTAHGT